MIMLAVLTALASLASGGAAHIQYHHNAQPQRTCILVDSSEAQPGGWHALLATNKNQYLPETEIYSSIGNGNNKRGYLFPLAKERDFTDAPYWLSVGFTKSGEITNSVPVMNCRVKCKLMYSQHHNHTLSCSHSERTKNSNKLKRWQAKPKF